MPTSLEIDTLYLGGGTPTHLSERQLTKLFETIERRCKRAGNCEVTIEANPCDVVGRQETFKRLGINRVSLGVQSFDAQKLQQLDRSHTRNQIVEAIEACRSFAQSLSIDLIFAAPDETLNDWRRDLAELKGLPINHISTYELTYEKGTRFWNALTQGRHSIATEDLRLEMYDLTIAELANLGFCHYEISSFAKPGFESRHNTVYWTGKPFLAVGPGAAGYLNGTRYQNTQSVIRYLQQVEAGMSPVFDLDELPPMDRAKELLAIGLRRINGIAENDFRDVSGLSFEQCAQNALRKLSELGLLTSDGGTIRLTARGVRLYDSVAVEILGK